MPVTIAYAFACACVLVPAAWGLVVVVASNAIERRLRKKWPRKELPPIEYHI